jgi:SNF2 family DNA or RNA helicase
MLRRSKDDTINGIRILDLPPKTIAVVKCDFSKLERRFYNSLEAKLGSEMERFQQTTGNRSYMQALTLLLRLRQGRPLRSTCSRLNVDHENIACDHPSLVNGDWKTDEDAVINQVENPSQEEDDDAKDLAKALDSLNLDVASKCQLCFIRSVECLVGEIVADVVPSLSGPKDTHCASCKIIVARNADISVSDSAKIRKVIELVDGIEERSNKTEKIIIFSQFTSMLRLIQEVLNERDLKFVQCRRSTRVQ